MAVIASANSQKGILARDSNGVYKRFTCEAYNMLNVGHDWDIIEQNCDSEYFEQFWKPYAHVNADLPVESENPLVIIDGGYTQGWLGSEFDVNNKFEVTVNGGVMPENESMIFFHEQGKHLTVGRQFDIHQDTSEIELLVTPIDAAYYELIFWMNDEAGFTQIFTGTDFMARTVTITVNSGRLPANTKAFFFFYENGQKLTETRGYNISGSDVTLTFDPIPAGIYVAQWYIF